MNAYGHREISLWAPLATSCSLTATCHVNTAHSAWRRPFSDNTDHISQSPHLWLATTVETHYPMAGCHLLHFHSVHQGPLLALGNISAFCPSPKQGTRGLIHDLEPSNTVSFEQEAFSIFTRKNPQSDTQQWTTVTTSPGLKLWGRLDFSHLHKSDLQAGPHGTHGQATGAT